MSRTVDIVIVNWNAGDHLGRCLSSVAAADQSGISLSSVTVVDNASQDGSLARLPQVDIPLEVIRNPANHGFAAACNQGAGPGAADYILFLNPDTRLEADALRRPLEFMELPGQAGIGICGIRMVGGDGHMSLSCARFPTPRNLVGDTLGLDRFWPGAFPHLMLPADDLKQSREVDTVIGAYFLVRRSLFEELAGFDEGYFVYFEEVDLVRRARELGYGSYFLADVSTFHQGAACSDNAPAERQYFFWRSAMRYSRKHFSRSGQATTAALVLAADPAKRILMAMRHGSRENLTITAKAYQLLVTDLWRQRARSDPASGRAAAPLPPQNRSAGRQ